MLHIVSHALTHWGRVTHICVSKLAIIGSGNSLSPGRRQAIIGTNAGILLIGTMGTNFSQNVIEIYTFSFKKMHLKMSSGKWRPFCLGLNVLTKFTCRHGVGFISRACIPTNLWWIIITLIVRIRWSLNMYVHIEWRDHWYIILHHAALCCILTTMWQVLPWAVLP